MSTALSGGTIDKILLDKKTVELIGSCMALRGKY